MKMTSEVIVKTVELAKAKLKDVSHEEWTDFEHKDAAVDFLDAIDGYVDDDDDSAELEDRLQDAASEWADGEPSVYTTELFDWYSQNACRIMYLDQALSEYGCDKGFQALMTGASIYYREAADIAIRCFVEALSEIES